MTKIASISLDIRKNNTVDNKPIILRQGESDVIIEATISNGGYKNLQIDFATFVAKKPDGTIISNDPTNVSGNVISYPVSKHLTESVGKIQDAYFMINNQITTCGFDISIIPSAQLDDTSVNYIPGIESINKFLESAEADWLGRIQQMKSQIDGLSIPDEFKLLMDKALSDAKAQYQPIIDAAEENVESIAADLAAKKLDLQNNSDELNKTIADIKTQVASVTSFLDGIQKQIIDANTSFTTGQQAKISQSIADSQKKLADSIASMQSQVAQSISDLKAQTDALVSGSAFQSLQNQVNNSAVGSNLLIGTNNTLTTVTNATNWANGLPAYRSAETLKANQTYTVSCYLEPATHDVSICMDTAHGNALGTTVAAGSKGISTLTITLTQQDAEVAGAFWIVFKSKQTDNSVVSFKGFKLEKGSVATDWCPNPSEIATNGSIQTAITNALDKADYSTTTEVDSKVSTGVGQAKTYAEQTIKGIIGAAPDTLDTIAELADAVTKNKDGVQAINDGITKKADKTELANYESKAEMISQTDYEAKKTAGTLENKFYIATDDTEDA